MRIVLWLLLLCLLSFAHDVESKVMYQKAVVVWFGYGTGDDDLSYQRYEVYKNGSKVPYMVGRTDVHSRALFIPDGAGRWSVKLTSEDGHGKEIEIEIGKDFTIQSYSKSPFERFWKIFVGVSLIFMIFFGLKLIKKGER